jgi:hypothetical protein
MIMNDADKRNIELGMTQTPDSLAKYRMHSYLI